MSRPRAREIGLVVGKLPTGADNAITDVAGVCVGHATLVRGDGRLVPGAGPVRTGVTAVLPHEGNLFREKVPAAVHTVNGFGKPCGFEQVRELGTIETPVLLTNTLSVGRVWDAAVSYAIREDPEIGISAPTVNPIVAETNDGYLNDIQGRHVAEADVWEAIRSARGGPVEEGNVGAGTGTVAFGFKAGIGTASRRISDGAGGFVVGALVQANFGRREDLTIAGVPVGPRLTAQAAPAGDGSVVVILATDAPCSARQLGRLARRAALGLGLVGGLGLPGSGDFVIAFSTQRVIRAGRQAITPRPALADEPRALAGMFEAVVEATEEAVVNALLRAETMIGRDGHMAEAIPIDPLREILRL